MLFAPKNRIINKRFHHSPLALRVCAVNNWHNWLCFWQDGNRWGEWGRGQCMMTMMKDDEQRSGRPRQWAWWTRWWFFRWRRSGQHAHPPIWLYTYGSVSGCFCLRWSKRNGRRFCSVVRYLLGHACEWCASLNLCWACCPALFASLATCEGFPPRVRQVWKNLRVTVAFAW